VKTIIMVVGAIAFGVAIAVVFGLSSIAAGIISGLSYIILSRTS